MTTSRTPVATLVTSPMNESHLVDVRLIDAQSFSRPWSHATWLRELDDSSRIHLVAQCEGRVMGHAGAMLVVDEVHISTVATHLDHRRRGVALHLIHHLLSAVRIAGFDAVTLEVRAGDLGAQRLYGRFGFAPAGMRRDYYATPSDDAVVMWLNDLTSDGAGDRLDRVGSSLHGGPGGRAEAADEPENEP